VTTPDRADFSGLSVALATPFTSSGDVDMKAFRAVVKHVAEGGADVLVRTSVIR
jgi:dihydrodipicolinate synthase/N-acetylneuraminate lyase